MEFRTAVDTWCYGLVTVIALVVAALVFPVAHDRSPQGIGLLVMSVALAVGLPLLIMRTTRYVITQDHLRIRLAVFSWIIPLNEITGVRRLRKIQPGPAFSANSLEIRYGRDESIVVSPSERDRFMAALGVGTRLRGWG